MRSVTRWIIVLLGVCAFLGLALGAWLLWPAPCDTSCGLLRPYMVRMDEVREEIARQYRQTGKLEAVDTKVKLLAQDMPYAKSRIGANGTVIIAHQLLPAVLVLEPVIAADGGLQWRCEVLLGQGGRPRPWCDGLTVPVVWDAAGKVVRPVPASTPAFLNASTTGNTPPPIQR
jgi:hypothetical protein